MNHFRRGPMKRPSRPRTTAELSKSLHQRLNMYALAATAAGVGIAFAVPAEAKIVYTKTHQVIGFNGIYDLDLNHDRTVDFLIQELGYSQSTTTFLLRRWLFVKGALGTAIAGEGNYASALKAGADIGPRRGFIKGGSNGATMAFVYQLSQTSTRHSSKGNWSNVNNRYLGLKFKIKGKTHYGWARLSVQTGRTTITGTLTGYAYETVANHSIRAGETQEGDAFIEPSHQNQAVPAFAVSPHGALGVLALGAQAVQYGKQP
jgi:hypothetical protein